MSTVGLGWYVRRLRAMSAGRGAGRTADHARQRPGRAGRSARDARRARPPAARPTGPSQPRLSTTARDAVAEDAGRARARRCRPAPDGRAGPCFGVIRTDMRRPRLVPRSGDRPARTRPAVRVPRRPPGREPDRQRQAGLGDLPAPPSDAAGRRLLADRRRTVRPRGRRPAALLVAGNPFLSGIHWTSGIELGIRLMSWLWIRRLLDELAEGAADLFEHDPDAVRQIRWHQEYLAAFPSRGSSANNHVLAEAAGQLAAACAFPWFRRSRALAGDAAALLERELAANTFPQRPEPRAGHRLPPIRRRARPRRRRRGRRARRPAARTRPGSGSPRMLDAAAAVLDVTRPRRRGRATATRAAGCCSTTPTSIPGRSPWRAGAALLGPPRLVAPCAGRACGGTCSARSRPCRRQPRPPGSGPITFADAGWSSSGRRRRTARRSGAGATAARTGSCRIAAHAHADALSVEVRYDGVDILADPGTYCYHGEPAWRHTSARRSAHNTLELAGPTSPCPADRSCGVPRPRPAPRTRTEGHRQTWTAEHDGYRRLSVPATHRRAVSLDGDTRTLTVVDTLHTFTEVPVRLSWHLGPDVTALLDGSVAWLTWLAGGELHPGAPGAARGAQLDGAPGGGGPDPGLVLARASAGGSRRPP